MWPDWMHPDPYPATTQTQVGGAFQKEYLRQVSIKSYLYNSTYSNEQISLSQFDYVFEKYNIIWFVHTSY